jgi:hypothetical protein
MSDKADTEYLKSQRSELNDIIERRKGIEKAYLNPNVSFDIESVTEGWIHGLVPSINKYNSEVYSYNNTHEKPQHYAILSIGNNRDYDINYIGGYYDLYETIDKQPYYKIIRRVSGGKRAKSKKQNKSRKIKKNAKKSKTRKR